MDLHFDVIYVLQGRCERLSFQNEPNNIYIILFIHYRGKYHTYFQNKHNTSSIKSLFKFPSINLTLVTFNHDLILGF